MEFGKKVIEIDILGHSYVRRLEEYCRTEGIVNMGMDKERSLVRFIYSKPDSELIATVDKLNVELERYRTFDTIPDIAYLEIGSNDLHNNRFNWACSPKELAERVMEGVYTLKGEGVPHVVVGAAIPRTGDGKYGAASHIKSLHQTAHDLWYWECKSTYDTGLFNDTLQTLIAGCQGVYFWPKKGFNEKWGWKLCDGVHLEAGDPERQYFKIVRSMAINHADQLT